MKITKQEKQRILREYWNEKAKKYFEKHPKMWIKHLKRNKIWKKENPEWCKSYGEKWRREHPDYMKRYMKEYNKSRRSA